MTKTVGSARHTSPKVRWPLAAENGGQSNKAPIPSARVN